LGGEEAMTMNDLANYITGGDYMKAKAEAARATVEIEKIRADAEKFRADAATAIEKFKSEAEKARIIKSVFKMKLDNLDLSTISSYTGLSIEEIEQILN
jgi:hypothetical protein